MYFIGGKIKGVVDIKFNRMADPFSTLTNSKRKPTREQLLEAARLKVHTGEQGLYFPGRGLKSAIVAGCRTLGLKDGRKPLYPFLKAVLYVQNDLFFGVEEPDYIAEEFTLNKSMQMIPNFRPGLRTGWESRFTLAVLDDSLGQDSVRASMDAAGLLIGLGSGRPENGRFNVVEWEVTKAAKAA